MMAKVTHGTPIDAKWVGRWVIGYERVEVWHVGGGQVAAKAEPVDGAVTLRSMAPG